MTIENYIDHEKSEMRRCLKGWEWNREKSPDIHGFWDAEELRELFYSSWLEVPAPKKDEIDWKKYSNELNRYAIEVCKEFDEMVREIKAREKQE